MSSQMESYIPVQGSIYIPEDDGQRQLRIVYSIPEAGMDDETGILCLVPAYGGNIDSSVYRKMRCQFADEYNMAVLQCDYFGIQFMSNCIDEESCLEMQKTDTKDIDASDIRFIKLKESWADCNDMGVMQAMDIISMIMWFLKMLLKDKIPFNPEKIIAYGSSHGCYLSYLVNRLCPGLTKLIIDNSSYVYPDYLVKERELDVWQDDNMIKWNIAYLVKCESSMRLPREFYDLSMLYKNFQNECQIISFHGLEDDMEYLHKKYFFIKQAGKKAKLIPVSPSNVDGVILKSAEHGLEADLIKLFQLVMRKMDFSKGKNLLIPNSVVIHGENDYLEITYENLNPFLQWHKKIEGERIKNEKKLRWL